MLFAALGKAEPLISTAARQKFESGDRRTDGQTDVRTDGTKYIISLLRGR